MSTFQDFEDAVLKSFVHYNNNHTCQLNRLALIKYIQHLRGRYISQDSFDVYECVELFKARFPNFMDQDAPLSFINRIKHELRKKQHESIEPMCPDEKVKDLTVWRAKVEKKDNIKNMLAISVQLSYDSD